MVGAVAGVMGTPATDVAHLDRPEDNLVACGLKQCLVLWRAKALALAILVVGIFAWVNSGQKDLGQIGWSAGQAAVSVCIWSVTTFWGLVFTPVALAILGMMYWDDIEVRLLAWRGTLARLTRWQRRRAAAAAHDKRQQSQSKAAAAKSSKGRHKDNKTSALPAGVSAATVSASSTSWALPVLSQADTGLHARAATAAAGGGHVHSNPKTSVGSTQNKKQKSGSNVGTEKSGVQARTAKGSTGRPLQADIGGCNVAENSSCQWEATPGDSAANSLSGDHGKRSTPRRGLFGWLGLFFLGSTKTNSSNEDSVHLSGRVNENTGSPSSSREATSKKNDEYDPADFPETGKGKDSVGKKSKKSNDLTASERSSGNSTSRSKNNGGSKPKAGGDSEKLLRDYLDGFGRYDENDNEWTEVTGKHRERASAAHASTTTGAKKSDKSTKGTTKSDHERPSGSPSLSPASTSTPASSSILAASQAISGKPQSTGHTAVVSAALGASGASAGVGSCVPLSVDRTLERVQSGMRGTMGVGGLGPVAGVGVAHISESLLGHAGADSKVHVGSAYAGRGPAPPGGTSSAARGVLDKRSGRGGENPTSVSNMAPGNSSFLGSDAPPGWISQDHAVFQQGHQGSMNSGDPRLWRYENAPPPKQPEKWPNVPINPPLPPGPPPANQPYVHQIGSGGHNMMPPLTVPPPVANPPLHHASFPSVFDIPPSSSVLPPAAMLPVSWAFGPNSSSGDFWTGPSGTLPPGGTNGVDPWSTSPGGHSMYSATRGMNGNATGLGPPLPPLPLAVPGVNSMVQPPLPPGKPPCSPGNQQHSPRGQSSGQGSASTSSSWANVLKGKQEAAAAAASMGQLGTGHQELVDMSMLRALHMTNAPTEGHVPGGLPVHSYNPDLDDNAAVDDDPYLNNMLNELMGTPQSKWEQGNQWSDEAIGSAHLRWPVNNPELGLDSQMQYQQLFQAFRSGRPGTFNGANPQ
eukprot:CAMPEP_0114237510 /NCGR_PEP_ID=MMETSP0058-20121206/7430_1 /TAXON_ID=36894 /ORGANISM="Pyramimonas parkeae, CCMP726" /LENGTH=974 /DNA_ID=CAMNT_0001349559 /DNA_START=910 /DNA_END=3835 /DNA_ORIENTATION=-